MAYYSERNGIRQLIAKTYEITIDRYQRLFKVCHKYLGNLAWKYPTLLRVYPSLNGYHLLFNFSELIEDLRYNHIPNLFGVSFNELRAPKVGSYAEEQEEYDQTALLDFVEFVAFYCKTYKITESSPYQFIFIENDDSAFNSFQKEINDVFQRTRLLYRLNDQKQVERVIENDSLTSEVEKTLLSVKEPGLHKLLEEAIQYHRSHREGDTKVAVDKIWDAFERLKTYYCKEMGGNPQDNKKKSADKVIANIVEKVPPEFKKTFFDEFDTEFKALTKIGNNYVIRHPETYKTDISDPRHYDYFFNRCVSLITLAVQYLK